MKAFLGFVRKETLHLLRDRQTLAILLLLPVLQVLIFGFAVRTDVRRIPIAIVDPTPDVATLELRDRLAASERFHVTGVATSSRTLDPQFRAGTIRQALVLPPDTPRRSWSVGSRTLRRPDVDFKSFPPAGSGTIQP